MKCKIIEWADGGAVRYLDQTLLPDQEVHRDAATIDDMIEAIKALRVRGAPLIGIAAAMGLAAAASRVDAPDLTEAWIAAAVKRLGDARPTAVNLMWALERMHEVAQQALQNGSDREALLATLRHEAQRIWDEDIAMCRAIGEAGAELIPEGATVMTHCNAGALATGGIGTALGTIYVAHEQGKRVKVVSCETRPLRQGARLTSWELTQGGVPVTSIVDSAAASVLARGDIELVVTGADRIAANGDAANKIGTYGLAVLARAHGVPFYVAAPRSTFDLSLASGNDIPIEERGAEEVGAAPGAGVYNPAFDVTPAEYITGIVTDRGVLYPPYRESIAAIF
ncbi:MAG: S-methyl-5-thioribose-1-phosphate isomerase [Gemmatimonadales bacterium]